MKINLILFKFVLKAFLFGLFLPFHFLVSNANSVLQLATNINSCVVTGSKVYCWGSEAFHGARNIPSPPRDIEGVLFVKLSEYYGCAETKKGLKCWGDALYSPTQPPADLGGILQLSLSTYHACAITLDKKVKCWGSNRDRRLDVPLDLGVASQVVATESCTCAVTQDGVRCWGGINPNSCVPKDIGPIVQLAFSDDGYRCAITAVGGVRCWGDSEHWMEQREGTRIEGTAVRREITYLERITLMRRDPPRDLGFAKQLSVGRSHSCVLSEKGVQCWRNKMPID